MKNIILAFRPHLTDAECSRVDDQSGNIIQVNELVKILLTKEDSYFDRFCRVCEANGYPHWAQKLETALVDKQEVKVPTSVDNLPACIPYPYLCYKLAKNKCIF